MGVAMTTVFDADEIARTASLALEAARHSQPVQGFRGLYRGGDDTPKLDCFDEATARLSPLQKAMSLRDAFERHKKDGVQFAGSFATAESAVACGNTHGVRRFGEMTHADATMIAIAA